VFKTVVLATIFAGHAQAEPAPILASYWSNSGSLPPQYAWNTTVTIRLDGGLELVHCKGYATEGPACQILRAAVTDDNMQAIRDAALASGLLETPARETETPMVGGSLSGGVVFLDGVALKLLSQPAKADAPRVGAVLQAIKAAIPDHFETALNGE
jgi:hypothetical protein